MALRLICLLKFRIKTLMATCAQRQGLHGGKLKRTIWLKEAKRSHQFPGSPKRRAGRKRTKRDAIAERYNGVLPADSSYKQIANEFGTSVSTAKRAFGGK
jgi:epoxyqueuosine reductase QueG